MATGSHLINTSTNGQPSDPEDRPFSFAIGTQLFLNPTDNPTNGVLSFKVDTSLIVGGLATGVSNLAIGFATDAELNSLASWGNSKISTPSADLFAVGFGRNLVAPTKIGVNIQGSQVTTIGKPTIASGVDTASNAIGVTAHPFVTGDRVTVTSTGSVPGGLAQNVGYFVIFSDVNSIKLATSYANAISGSEIDIQSTGSGTITVASDEVFTLTRTGNSGTVNLQKGPTTIATFTNTNLSSPLRLFYWNREASQSSSLPVLKEIKVTGAI